MDKIAYYEGYMSKQALAMPRKPPPSWMLRWFDNLVLKGLSEDEAWNKIHKTLAEKRAAAEARKAMLAEKQKASDIAKAKRIKTDPNQPGLGLPEEKPNHYKDPRSI